MARQTLFLDRQIAIGTKLRAGLGEEQPEKMINLRHRGDGRFAAAARDALLDGDAGRHAFDQIDIRLFQLLDELPRVGRHAVEKTALPFGKKNIEREGRFARTAQAGDDHHLVARNIERDVLQVVLARAVDADGVAASAERWQRRAERLFGRAQRVFAARHRVTLIDFESRGARATAREARALPRIRLQKSPGVRRVDFATTLPAFRRRRASPPSSPASGPRSMTQSAHLITSRLCSITTMRIACFDQALEHFTSMRDIVEMQAGRRLVEDEKIAAGGSVSFA